MYTIAILTDTVSLVVLLRLTVFCDQNDLSTTQVFCSKLNLKFPKNSVLLRMTSVAPDIYTIVTFIRLVSLVALLRLIVAFDQNEPGTTQIFCS